MNKFIFLVFFSFMAQCVIAQIGLDINYGKHQYPDWDHSLQAINVDSDNLFDQGLRIGVDYWFRPIKKRMEMTIGINYGRYDASFQYSDGHNSNTTMDDLGLDVKNNFYLLDFEEDCDCPTFNKQGEVFKKGLYLQTILGTSYQIISLSDINETSNNLAYRVGLGAGFDIGVSPILTISPYFNYQYGFNYSLNQVLPSEEGLDDKSYRKSLNIGVRFGYTRKKRRY